MIPPKIEKAYSLKEIKKIWRNHILESKKGEDNISFYVHIPFCMSKCEYCRHFYWKYSYPELLEIYIKALIKKMDFFKNVFLSIKFKTIYIGGGTPSLLNEKQLINLFEALYKNFKFEKDGEKTFECNVYSTSLEKLKILESYGINRISFGVQSTDKKILRLVNRGYQSFSLVKKAIEDAQKCKKFKRINVDLVIGLWQDSAEKAVDSFSKVASLRPHSIAVYPLQPTREYLNKYYRGDEKYFYKELGEKVKKFFKLIQPILRRYDYFYLFPDPMNVSTDAWNFISRNYHHYYKYSYDDTKAISCFSLGSGSSSYIFGKFRYQNVEGIYSSLWTGGWVKKIYRGIRFKNPEEYLKDRLSLKNQWYKKIDGN